MTGEELKALRLQLHLSQESFAFLLGARPNQISRWESGKVKMGKLYLEKLKKEMERHGI